jgi:subtilisin family serine protease
MTVIQNAITIAREAGIIIIAAADNNGKDSLIYSAAHKDVVAVPATDHSDSKASFSSFGAFVNLAAHSVCVYSADLGGSYCYASGTSMACLHVGGIAALLDNMF